jgi:16S rRNA (adenine1518-N6/adenine1519-N6)-dimethyltransferase
MDHPLSLAQLDVPRLLREYNLHPSKGLGQNFLIDDEALQQVVQAAQLTPTIDILEVGAGLGSLTRYLAASAHSVVAVELDTKLIPVLQRVVAHLPNVHVVQGDILDLDPGKLVLSPDYIVVANIPYYITSALIRHFLEASLPPNRLVLTIQHEVAIRICAVPGDMSLLALSVQVYGQPRIVTAIPARAFYPPPKVDSSIIRIDRYPTPLIPTPLLGTFFQLIKAGFSQKRKTLRNSLSAGLRLSPAEAESLLVEADIDPKRRAETLSLAEWHQLTMIMVNSKKVA